jgi:hypothetical protein
VIVTLEGEELVNRRDRGGVSTAQPYDAAARNCVGRVSDDRSARYHLASSGNLTSMHEPGQREVAATEGAGDPLHVGTNLSYTGGIARVTLEDDAASIRQRLESVERSVLIDAHGYMPARLHPGEGAVGGCTAGAAVPVLPCFTRAATQNPWQEEQKR